MGDPRAIVFYIARRVLQAIFVVWAAYTVTFFILYALPSDPVSLIIGTDANNYTPEQIAALRAEYGLDQHIVVQYLSHLTGVLVGDFGTSYSTGQPVDTMIGEALWPTIQISVLGLILAIVVGGGLAIAANYTRLRWIGNLLLALPPLGVAVPGFWFGLMLIQWFSFTIPIFPAMGDRGPASLVLPAITLALPTGAMFAQLLSKSLATTLREPYIDTVWAKGADRRRVVFGHALKNASLPAFTMLGLIVGQLLAGAVVTETVFSRPGVGRTAATAVQSQDIPVVLGVVLLAAFAFAIANLIVDLVYPLLDPRIVTASGGSRRAAAAADGDGDSEDKAGSDGAADAPGTAPQLDEAALAFATLGANAPTASGAPGTTAGTATAGTATGGATTRTETDVRRPTTSGEGNHA